MLEMLHDSASSGLLGGDAQSLPSAVSAQCCARSARTHTVWQRTLVGQSVVC